VDLAPQPADPRWTEKINFLVCSTNTQLQYLRNLCYVDPWPVRSLQSVPLLSPFNCVTGIGGQGKSKIKMSKLCSFSALLEKVFLKSNFLPYLQQ
jgi:hypothetical protein